MKVARLGSSDLWGERNVVGEERALLRGKSERKYMKEEEMASEKKKRRQRKKGTNYKVNNQPIDNINLKDDKKLAVMMTL